jgi:hypothetical protein
LKDGIVVSFETVCVGIDIVNLEYDAKNTYETRSGGEERYTAQYGHTTQAVTFI